MILENFKNDDCVETKNTENDKLKNTKEEIHNEKKFALSLKNITSPKTLVKYEIIDNHTITGIKNQLKFSKSDENNIKIIENNYTKPTFTTNDNNIQDMKTSNFEQKNQRLFDALRRNLVRRQKKTIKR